jgi:hypothetical protein
LRWKRTEQEISDDSSGSEQAAEGAGVARYLNEDRNVQDGVQGDQVLLGTGERTSESMSPGMSPTCNAVRHLEETPGQPDGAQVSPDLSWS